MNNETVDFHVTKVPAEEKAVPTLTPGMVLGNKYQLLEQIGRGGMGVVWKANDRLAERLVALKFVPRELKRFETEMDRVRVSFRRIHALNHQWICPTYVIEDGGEFGYYLVMKYLEGKTLDNYVLQKDPKQRVLPFSHVISILSRVAEALDYAHLNKVIHRDIKPSNIFLTKVAGKMHVQIIDFGLVDEIKSTLSRVSQMQFDISGTRPYMAPEQWQGKQQSAATDQYALGVVAYELLAGHLPFECRDFQMLENAVINLAPEPISMLPDVANAVLQRALAKNPANRFRSCQEFVTALNEASAAADTPSPSSGWVLPSLPPNVPRWAWATTLSCFLFFIIGLIVLTGPERGKTDTPDGSLPSFQSSFPDIFGAAARGTVQDVAYFVNNGAKVNAKDSAGMTPLFYAATANPNVEVLGYLISKGADVNAKNRAGKSPLDVVNTDEKGHVLREAGAIPSL